MVRITVRVMEDRLIDREYEDPVQAAEDIYRRQKEGLIQQIYRAWSDYPYATTAFWARHEQLTVADEMTAERFKRAEHGMRPCARIGTSDRCLKYARPLSDWCSDECEAKDRAIEEREQA